MVHVTVFVADDSMAPSGTANPDARSSFIKYEGDFVLYGEKGFRRLTGWVENRAQQSRPFVPPPATLLQDPAEGLILALAFQL
jgi:cardiolipin synthase